jgi:hypothetical protein
MRNRLAHARVTIAALALAASTASAQIYRCTSAGGGVTYQERPCEGGEAAQPVNIPAAFPAVNSVERERLLQREAALDARLLERARIEAAERIAREARSTREAELAAERERARARQPEVLVVYPSSYRPHRPGRRAWVHPR